MGVGIGVGVEAAAAAGGGGGVVEELLSSYQHFFCRQVVHASGHIFCVSRSQESLLVKFNHSLEIFYPA